MAVRIEASLLQRLYRDSAAERWALDRDAFAQALTRSAEKTLGADAADRADLERHLNGLHLRDLALARACELGIESAWDEFVREYRPTLYRAADSLDRSGGARELADSLYGDLFGLQEQDGTRRSLFRYFHGRSSLSTWLRAVLSQRHVDRLRSARREEGLPDDDSNQAIPTAAAPPQPERGRYLQLMTRGLARAVAALDVRDRLRLACYYAQELTLAQTGKLLGEHEATASRHLARTRKQIRKDVEHHLKTEQQLSDVEIEQCFASVSGDAGTLSLSDVLGSAPGPEAGACAEAGRPPDELRKTLAVHRSKKEGK